MSAATRTRPRDDSAAALSRAVAQLAADRRAALATIDTETARRGTLLVSGTTADIAVVDEAVRQARLSIERIDAQTEHLSAQLAAASARERIARVEGLRIEAVAAADRFAAWWTEKYAPAAQEIAGGLRLERIARNARTAFDQAAEHADSDSDITSAGGVACRDLPPVTLGHVGSTLRSPSLLICLPATEPGPAIAWPIGFTLERPRVRGEAAAYA